MQTVHPTQMEEIAARSFSRKAPSDGLLKGVIESDRAGTLENSKEKDELRSLTEVSSKNSNAHEKIDPKSKVHLT